jgi:putative transposase
MTIPRAKQVSLEHTPYYHCISRCVRRAFLCGKDRFTGRDYSHRRAWIEKRFVQLSTVFAIDVVAYAVMSNHFHVVVRINDRRPMQWSEEEVIERWSRLFRVTDNMKNAGNVQLWRERLASISWYMRCINEPLARWANREDDCVGRFWQGRFKLQALLDEASLLKCMAYVDLNPVRAGLIKDPRSAPFTSIKARSNGTDEHLVPLRDQASDSANPLWLDRREYLELVDWTAHAIRRRMQPKVAGGTPSALGNIGIVDSSWLREIRNYGRWYFRAVGSIAALERYRCRLGVQWLKGTGRATQPDLQPA